MKILDSLHRWHMVEFRLCILQTVWKVAQILFKTKTVILRRLIFYFYSFFNSIFLSLCIESFIWFIFLISSWRRHVSLYLRTASSSYFLSLRIFAFLRSYSNSACLIAESATFPSSSTDMVLMPKQPNDVTSGWGLTNLGLYCEISRVLFLFPPLVFIFRSKLGNSKEISLILLL